MELRSDYYLQPFETYLWMVLLSGTILGTLLIITAQSLISDKKRFLIDNLFLALETFCNQCGNEVIETSPLRLIVISLRLIAIMSIAMYGAVITSFFAIEIFKLPFTNLEELVNNGEYKFVVPYRDPFTFYLKVN